MYIKPTKHIHTDGKRKSLKGVGAGGREFPPGGRGRGHRGTKLSNINMFLIKFAAS